MNPALHGDTHEYLHGGDFVSPGSGRRSDSGAAGMVATTDGGVTRKTRSLIRGVEKYSIVAMAGFAGSPIEPAVASVVEFLVQTHH